MSTENPGKLQDASQFEDNPQGWAKRWDLELTAAKDSVSEWHKAGRDIVNRFLDRREAANVKITRLNLFTSNTQTTRAFLYGKVPQVDVKRRWGDPNDKLGRAAGEMMQRLLNTDIERDNDNFTRALKYALSDRLLPGFGTVRLRYTMQTKKRQVEPQYKTDEFGVQNIVAEGYEEEAKASEDVEIDYVHWDDFLWSAGAKTWEEVRWVAFKAPLTREGLYERFLDIFKNVMRQDDGDNAKPEGEDPEYDKQIEARAKGRLNEVPLTSTSNKQEASQGIVKSDPWSRADIWEIWDKEHKKVWWVVQGFDEILDDKPDTLGLAGFWPCPCPLIANLTTDAFMPRPDFIIAQDLYNEIDVVSGRINLLEQAIVVRGVYNGNMKAIERLLNEAAQNELIPIPDWPAFMEKGGFKGNIEWMPIEQIVEALTVLRDYRKELVALSQQITGMSDILRGESSDRATATEQAIKAKFASIRLQDFQDEFARFASDVQKIRAEIIVKFFDDKTIIDRSNILYTADKDIAPVAVKLLRDNLLWYRIQVKPESVSSTDYSAMQQERTQVMAALTQFMQVVLPVGQTAPTLVPGLLKIAQWMFTSFRGATTIEPIFEALAQEAEKLAQMAMQKMMQPPQPGPKEQAQIQQAQIKAEAEIKKATLGVQGAQLDHQQKTQQMGLENQQTILEHGVSMQKLEGDLRLEGMRIAEKMAPEGASGGKK